ncbi:hypothetical protein ASPFODRAFT_148347, partial [Aspergillus luchuensis CBS 106.47]
LATVLRSILSLDGSKATDRDYTGTSRQTSSCSGFTMDEEEIPRRGGAVGHPLAQPVSSSATNNLRYDAQQPVVQKLNVPMYTKTMLMSPNDTCSGSSPILTPLSIVPCWLTCPLRVP